ncbi:hypothetical protein FBZ89_12653 [Nitrospirillum amazonense]|uniref:Uncharacterized protein n=1 Tax=Nitrospirillum amazonense TaxID=28077 RepID=A0A560ESP6_9PROT|nr:hypothetical protein FBZ89_12653 [Nitrospirillum amazonense]
MPWLECAAKGVATQMPGRNAFPARFLHGARLMVRHIHRCRCVMSLALGEWMLGWTEMRPRGAVQGASIDQFKNVGFELQPFLRGGIGIRTGAADAQKHFGRPCQGDISRHARMCRSVLGGGAPYRCCGTTPAIVMKIGHGPRSPRQLWALIYNESYLYRLRNGHGIVTGGLSPKWQGRDRIQAPTSQLGRAAVSTGPTAYGDGSASLRRASSTLCTDWPIIRISSNWVTNSKQNRNARV